MTNVTAWLAYKTQARPSHSKLSIMLLIKLNLMVSKFANSNVWITSQGNTSGLHNFPRPKK